MVAGSGDFEEVMTGPQGLLSDPGRVPGLVVDSSTVSMDVSSVIRERAAGRGVALLAAPVSGNPKAARAGKLSIAVSGPREAYERAEPYLRMLGRSVSYVGEGEAARLVKICHNLILGVVAQVLAETTVLAERGGVARADYLAFINDSVMGSTFSRYKTPAYVNLDYAPTFTGHLLRKDFELGLEAARQLDVPLPVTALTHQIVVSLIGQGFGEMDFAALLEVVARGADFTLEADDRFVPDGLDTP
jgi:3-hydroxyisobutyrate dehydrogenase-like beta-hydroxyacid dehydrogenase